MKGIIPTMQRYSLSHDLFRAHTQQEDATTHWIIETEWLVINSEIFIQLFRKK